MVFDDTYHCHKCKFLVMLWFSQNKGKTWIKDQQILFYQKYYFWKCLIQCTFWLSLVSPKRFSKSGLCIIFLLLHMLLCPTVCVSIFFPPKKLENFCITFDISSSKKWNPDKTFKNIMLSAALGAGWCHDVPKRCFSDSIKSRIKDNWLSRDIYRAH